MARETYAEDAPRLELRNLYSREGLAGTGLTSREAQKAITKGTSEGVRDGYQRILSGNDPWMEGDLDLRKTSGGLFSQHGLAVVGAGAGAFAQGYQSGNVFSGGLSGAFTGLGAAESLGKAFPSIASMANPIAAIGGAALGIIGSPLGGRAKRKL